MFPSGVCALAVSSLVALFCSRVGQPQPPSVSLTFTCGPTGGNLLSGVGDLTDRLHSRWEKAKVVEQAKLRAWSFFPKVKLLDGR